MSRFGDFSLFNDFFDGRCLLVAKEISDKERSSLRFSLLLGSLNDLFPLFLSLFVFHHVFPVVVALKVQGLLLAGLVVGNVSLAPCNDHKVFPVLYNNDDEDDELEEEDDK